MNTENDNDQEHISHMEYSKGTYPRQNAEDLVSIQPEVLENSNQDKEETKKIEEEGTKELDLDKEKDLKHLTEEQSDLLTKLKEPYTVYIDGPLKNLLENITYKLEFKDCKDTIKKSIYFMKLLSELQDNEIVLWMRDKFGAEQIFPFFDKEGDKTQQSKNKTSKNSSRKKRTKQKKVS